MQLRFISKVTKIILNHNNALGINHKKKPNSHLITANRRFLSANHFILGSAEN